MLRAAVLMLAATTLFGQTAAALLERLNGVEWEAPPAAGCAANHLAQMDIYATVEWTRHCTGTRDGVVREDFFYVFGEPARAARLRVDLRPADESARNTARLLPALEGALTARFGAATSEPELREIGFGAPRVGQAVAGSHWKGGGLHYFLHANQGFVSPMGVRKGVQLTVMNDRLWAERMQDARILRVEGFGGEGDDAVRARLSARVGAAYTRTMRASGAKPEELPRVVSEGIEDLKSILRDADLAGPPRRALCLLAADGVIGKLSVWLTEGAEAEAVRRILAPYRVKLGGMTHHGGLAYQHELLWRVWKESPETEAGELAFLALERRGWYTWPGEGCPANPDLFREVIDRAEAFLAGHARSDFRKEVLYALAVANESWWSTARAAADDPWVSAPSYPRRAANAKEAERARGEALRCYREVARLAPDSPEGASALRRIPRLELGIDTGQRRFFCSYC